ncbi:MAG: metal-dependent hydrolase [Magnetococcales bacterium]|nr:metal-dependent hydrolase [Magnetococcales bacterium]
MIIGHLPISYLAAVAMHSRTQGRFPVWVGCVAGVVPDVDMIWFYLVDSSTHHHQLVTHWPVSWVGVAMLLMILFQRYTFVVVAALGFVFLHLLLDTIAGAIPWLAPFDMTPSTWVVVPARYSWWVANFIFHWTFLLELVLTISAVTIWIRRAGVPINR